MDSYLETGDLKTYINKKHKDTNLFALKSERNNVESLLSSLKSNILNEFLSNDEYFMGILNQHERIYKNFKILKENLNEYRKFLGQLDTHKVINEKKRIALINIFNKFEDDMSSYLDNQRYLIYSTKMKIENQSVIVIFTNDFLFLGIKEKNKYKLYNGYTYFTIKVEFEDHIVKILEPENIILKGNVENVKKFKDIYEERVYKYEEDVEQLEDIIDINKIEYLIQVEDFESLKEFKDQINIENVCKNIDKYNHDTLKNLLGIFDDQKMIYKVLKIFISKRIENLIYISESYNINLLLDSLFKNYHIFSNEVEKFVEELDKNVDKNILNLMLNDFILEKIFIFLAKRIFWKNRDIRIVDELINKVKLCIQKKNVNCDYLMILLTEKRDFHFKIREEKFKNDVRNIINDFLKEKN